MSKFDITYRVTFFCFDKSGGEVPGTVRVEHPAADRAAPAEDGVHPLLMAPTRLFVASKVEEFGTMSNSRLLTSCTTICKTEFMAKWHGRKQPELPSCRCRFHADSTTVGAYQGLNSDKRGEVAEQKFFNAISAVMRAISRMPRVRSCPISSWTNTLNWWMLTGMSIKVIKLEPIEFVDDATATICQCLPVTATSKGQSRAVIMHADHAVHSNDPSDVAIFKSSVHDNCCSPSLPHYDQPQPVKHEDTDTATVQLPEETY